MARASITPSTVVAQADSFIFTPFFESIHTYIERVPVSIVYSRNTVY